jgi:3-oxoacyl-[acyl-carrier protein] reductase
MNDLNERVALVTGGTRGIGRAIALGLASAGAHVVVTGRDAASAETAAAEIARAAGVAEDQVLGFAADVRDLPALETAVARTVDRFGGLDAVIANAGVGRMAPIEDLSTEAWRETVDVNLTGVFHTVKASLRALRDRQGMFITIGSLAGVNAFAGGSAYNASKFGLVGFTHAIMLDLREQGVRVSTIMPGSVATAFGGHVPDDADAWKIQPEDLADAVLYLLRTPARTLPSRIEVRPARTRGH